MFSWQPPRQVLVIGGVMLAAVASVWLATGRSQCRAVQAGFWFDEVAPHNLERLGGPVTEQEMDTIITVARAELTDAFAGLNITFTDRRDATYRVRVVQELVDMRFRRYVPIPAESRAVSGFGGLGAVSFSWLASSAVAYAPPDADRSAVVEAIGRGIGRSAVHEFVHVILPRAPIHATKDILSYEYYSAARPEQYFGKMRWDLAWPLLKERLRPCAQGGV